MADIESSESFDDELLSAFVDGELDVDQRALVEERLRDNPRAKQLVDELRDLSATLQALPREQIGSELREEVMQQIEAKVISPLPREDRGNGMRRWAWAAMAIAATLMLSVFLPEVEKEERELAKVEVGAKPQAEGGVVSELRVPAEASVEESSVAEGAELHAAVGVDENEFTADLDVAERTKEEFGEFLLIHIAVADAETGQQRFDDLLASNYIDLEAEPSDTSGLRGKAKSLGAVASSEATFSSSPEPSAQAEIVLVEASAVQIENLLLECNADTKNWKSMSFETQADASLPVPRWRSLERKGSGVAKPGLLSALESTDDEAVARASETTASQEKKSYFSKNKSARGARRETTVPRGRATRLGSDWNQVPGLQKAGEGGGGVLSSDPAAQIRVLFVLHSDWAPSESAEAFSGKKAAASK